MDKRYGPNELTRYFERGSFALEGGSVVPDVTVAYRTWGSLNEQADNAIVVCHALTGDANVDHWWSDVIGSGRAIDTDSYFVVASNVLGGCYGTTGPTSARPGSDRRWGPDFPEVTVRDMVRLQRQLADHLGIERVASVIGGSIGGMQALEWAVSFPHLVASCIPIAIGADHSAWAVGLNHAQRGAIYADPDWRDGRYDESRPPAAGLALARQIAMLSYRSPESFAQKFSRARTPDEAFAVSSYLDYQGAALVDRFDANTYVTLTHAMDHHDVTTGRGAKADVLATVTMPVLVVGISSDVLYPLEEQHELTSLLPNAEYRQLDSPHGHDSFLIEQDRVGKMIESFLGNAGPHVPVDVV